MFRCVLFFFFFKQKTAYEMRISDWSSDVCSSDLVIGLAAADAKIGAGRRDQRLGMWDDFGFGARRRIGREAFAQALALGDVEHCEPFQEGNGAGIVARLHRARLLGVGNEAVGIDDVGRSEEHTSELQSLMRISYAVFCLKKKTHYYIHTS